MTQGDRSQPTDTNRSQAAHQCHEAAMAADEVRAGITAVTERVFNLAWRAKSMTEERRLCKAARVLAEAENLALRAATELREARAILGGDTREEPTS